MHHRYRLKLGKHRIECSTVTDIHLIEAIAWRGGCRAQRLQVAGIGEFVEVGDLCGSVVDQVANYSRADKASAAGNKNAHQRFSA
ncbi:hypothetical protein D3C84_1173100 [compost metagenome]